MIVLTPDGTVIKYSQGVKGDMFDHHLQPNRQRVLERQTESITNKQTDRVREIERERGRLLARACNVSAIGGCPAGGKCKGPPYSTEGGRHHGCCPCGGNRQKGVRDMVTDRLGVGGEREETLGELLC